MNMSADIRVKTDTKYKNIYNELKNFAFGDMHEIFFLCACLGFREKKKENISVNDDRFWSKTITSEEYSCYYAMILSENNSDFSSIDDDKKVLSEIEKYANAGIKIFVDELLSDYIIDIDGACKLDRQLSRELPKSILHYIYESVEDVC